MNVILHLPEPDEIDKAEAGELERILSDQPLAVDQEFTTRNGHTYRVTQIAVRPQTEK